MALGTIYSHVHAVEGDGGQKFWVNLLALRTLVRFLCACSYLCKSYISRREVDRADELLVKFCAEFEQLYGKEAVTPNLHMHMHLKDCIQDKEPVYTF